MPHSHNDVGWLKTMDDYYISDTDKILNNMYEILTSDPSIKFSWAESAYLSKWLKEYPEKKEGFKQLVHSGQVEIIGGGWTQNFLKKELNITRLKTGWQIDPFGHSSLTPALWEKMGFETLFFSRVSDMYKVFSI